MAFQKSVSVRNAELDAIETQIGASAVVKIFSGAEPANCAAADPAGLLATIQLPGDYFNNAASGQKTKLGTWSGAASAGGTIASWRIYDNGTTTCHLHSITWSARSKSVLGNITPIALATVDDQFKFGRLLNWQIARFASLQDAIHMIRRASPRDRRPPRLSYEPPRPS